MSKYFASGWRDMSYVPRWGIARRIRTQNLAEHSYFVALYSSQIADIIKWGGDRGELLKYALLHDIDETITGDIPGPFKRAAVDKIKAKKAINDVMVEKFGPDNVSVINDASDDIKNIVKVADCIDEICYLEEESLMGNHRWLEKVRKEAMRRLVSRFDSLPFKTKSDKDSAWSVVFESLVDQISEPVLLKDTV